MLFSGSSHGEEVAVGCLMLLVPWVDGSGLWNDAMNFCDGVEEPRRAWSVPVNVYWEGVIGVTFRARCVRIHLMKYGWIMLASSRKP